MLSIPEQKTYYAAGRKVSRHSLPTPSTHTHTHTVKVDMLVNQVLVCALTALFRHFSNSLFLSLTPPIINTTEKARYRTAGFAIPMMSLVQVGTFTTLHTLL